jgi:hypothetical protein
MKYLKLLRGRYGGGLAVTVTPARMEASAVNSTRYVDGNGGKTRTQKAKRY